MILVMVGGNRNGFLLASPITLPVLNRIPVCLCGQQLGSVWSCGFGLGLGLGLGLVRVRVRVRVWFQTRTFQSKGLGLKPHCMQTAYRPAQCSVSKIHCNGLFLLNE